MEEIQKLFGTSDLYSILNIDKSKVSDPKALKTGYLKAALSWHPDKGTEDEREIRTQKFQVVQKIYELLQDEDLRKSYDETGEWPDAEKLEFDMTSFGRLDESSILEFKKYYIGSDEERQDVKRYYEESKGNILHVLDNLYFANILDDESRVQAIIDDLISKKEMEKMTKGTPSSKSKNAELRKAKKEAKEAEEMQKQMNMGDSSFESLQKAITQNRARKADAFLDEMEKKYSELEKSGKKKGKRANSFPKETPEEKKPKKSVSSENGSSRSTRSRK